MGHTMTDEPPTFGKLLREARQRAGFSTIAALADHLSAAGLLYTDEAIGHWENDRRAPPREVLLRVLAVLAEKGGIRQLSEINRMLWALGWRDLSAQEQTTHFPILSSIVIPSALPARPYDRLVGRDDLVQTMITHLTNPTARPVIVVSGLGGIGKTALAYEVISRVVDRFEGLAWESARSEEFAGVAIRVRQHQRVNLHSLLVSVAQQLGFPALAALAPDVLQRRLREIVRSGSYLIVLDNLETLDAAREVARALYELVSPPAGARPSRVVITSRERLVDEDYVYDQFVRGLSEPDALALLELEARNRGVAGLVVDDSLGHHIYTVTGGMPLALKLLVSQFLLGIALDQELDRLEQATGEEELYRFIYFSLWEKLSLNAQKVLVGAAAFGTSAQRAMLARVSQVAEAEFDLAIADLVRASLIEVITRPDLNQPRYDIHAMTRWFVNAPLTELWNQQRRQSQAEGDQPLR